MENYLQQIKQIISHKTGTDVQEIGEDTYLEEDLNIGEIELLEIITDIEDALDIEVTADTEDIKTVGDLASHVADKLE